MGLYMKPSFLKIEEFDANEIKQPIDALGQMRANEIGAVLVRNVFPNDLLAKLPAVLEANAPDFIKTTFPAAFCAYFYGINLNLADRDLAPYFASEPAFREMLASLDFGEIPFEGRVSRLLSLLDQERPYRAAPGPKQQRHFFTTLRAHLEGGYIPAHFDNESAVRPTYKYVASACEADIYSFVICIDQAEAGGALEVYNITSAEAAHAFRNRDTGSSKQDLTDIEKISIRLEPGEMIILHSSRYLHGVSKVEGSRTRWTACSFMALAKDGSEVLCWG